MTYNPRNVIMTLCLGKMNYSTFETATVLLPWFLPPPRYGLPLASERRSACRSGGSRRATGCCSRWRSRASSTTHCTARPSHVMGPASIGLLTFYGSARGTRTISNSQRETHTGLDSYTYTAVSHGALTVLRDTRCPTNIALLTLNVYVSAGGTHTVSDFQYETHNSLDFQCLFRDIIHFP